MEAAVLSPDVARLEKGLDTIVGPRSVRLLGGQVQRVAAARKLIRETELLAFDDLSSALDVETERLLWRNLLRTQGARTYLVVSHRRATLRHSRHVTIVMPGKCTMLIMGSQSI